MKLSLDIRSIITRSENSKTYSYSLVFGRLTSVIGVEMEILLNAVGGEQHRGETPITEVRQQKAMNNYFRSRL